MKTRSNPVIHALGIVVLCWGIVYYGGRSCRGVDKAHQRMTEVCSSQPSRCEFMKRWYEDVKAGRRAYTERIPEIDGVELYENF